jgi:hypothetical protein
LLGADATAALDPEGCGRETVRHCRGILFDQLLAARP